MRQRWIIGCFFMLLCCGLYGWSSVATAQLSQPVAAVLVVNGAIGPATQDFVQRGLAQAQHQGARLVVLQLDTPGGLSKSMRGIIQAILASPIPIVTYVAPSGARAASAGTFIIYASHIAAMAPGTNLGAATPVSIGAPSPAPQGGPEQKKEKSASELKAINDAQAYIRSLAQLRGRNVEWAEQAVAQAASLSAREALKKNVIDIIANNISDLLAQVDGKTVTIDGQAQVLQTRHLLPVTIQPDWRTRFLSVITNPSVAYLLLMAGVYGLFFEFANPGYIVPGVVGAICLLLALYALQLLPVNYVGLGLILLGLAFLIAEAFLPSFGILGIGGVISLVVGSVLLLRIDMPGAGVVGLPWALIATVTGVTVVFVLGVLQFAIRSHRRKVVSGAEAMVGQRGTIVVQAHDQVWVRVSGELWRVSNAKGWRAGQRVTVVGLDGLEVEVESETQPTQK